MILLILQRHFSPHRHVTDDDIKVANAFPSRSSQSALNIHDISSHHMTDDDIKVANALLS